LTTAEQEELKKDMDTMMEVKAEEMLRNMQDSLTEEQLEEAMKSLSLMAK
jgi:hypothetical protein